MSFNLFGTPTTDDIKVGYIDSTLGYVDGVTICEANDYAKDNPGTTFIFKDGDNNLQYLNINEVNNLTPQDLSPKKSDECGGIQQYKDCGPPRIQFFGGGGVGATGNPVVGRDGSLLAVDIVSGGHGYQYPPIVAARDDCQFGNGTVLTAVLGETADETEVYEGEEDFEEYELCPDTDVGYGIKYGPNGEELGAWEPQTYTKIGEDPIKREIEIFQKALQKPFWTTRKDQPDRIFTTEGEPGTLGGTKEYPNAYNVTHPAWNEFMNQYAVSPVKPSDVTGSDEAGKVFSLEWELNFPVSGEYIFRGLCDNTSQVYIDGSLVGDLKSFKDNPSPLQKTISEGNHILKIDLLNVPIGENVPTTTTSQSNLQAKFIQKGSSYYLQVDGTGSGEISFIMDVNDKSYIAGLAAKEVRIPSDSESLKFIRTEYRVPTTIRAASLSLTTISEEKIKKSGTFTGGRLYGPIEIIGADPGAKGPIPIKTSSNKLGLRDADGDDENIKITITNASSTTTPTTTPTTVEKVISPKSWNDNPMGVSMIIDAPLPPVPQEQPPVQTGRCPPNPIWTTRFPGASQKWYPVRFSGSTTIVKESVPSTPTPSSETQEVQFTISGRGNPQIKYMSFTFTSVDGQHTFELTNVEKTGKTKIEKIQIRKNVNYVVVAKEDSTKFKKVEQGLIKEGTKKKEGGIGESNKIFTDFIGSANDNNDMQITSNVGKFISSNKGKIGGRSTYDLTYRYEASPGGSKNTTTTSEVYNAPGWSKFMNRYAISPILPLNTPGSDVSGTTFSNSWEIDLPYAGFYGVKGTRDNAGRILIDGKEVSSLDGFSVDNPKLSKVYLTKGRHTIVAEILNKPVETKSVVDTKIFSTQDWRVSGPASPSTLKASFIKQGSSFYLQVDGTGSGQISFLMDVNDRPGTAGLAAKEVIIPSDSGGVSLKRDPKKQNDKDRGSGTFSGGKKYGPIQIIGAGSKSKGPIINNPNRLGIRDADGNDENIKVTIGSIEGSSTTSTTAISQSPTKNGVTYQGPELFGYVDSRWSKYMNEFSVSPKVSENVGKFTLTWKDVNFPYVGTYKFNFQADNIATLKVGNKEIFKTSDFIGEKVQYTFNATPGKYDVVIELENLRSGSGGKNDSVFAKNPMGVALFISKDVVFSDTNKTPWTTNPVGISAILIPPPCARKIGGKGVVEKVIVEDPGNGYLPPQGEGYPVTLVLDQVIVENPGINYRCGEDQLQITPNNGAQLSYDCDPFGKIKSVKVLNPGVGFNVYPEITLPSETGVNATFRPTFKVVRDPLLPPDKIIQVTDLVGLKQTGYVDGRAYYGAIYYDEGVPYAGYYKTAGTQVRVYATLQESITAQVTTPPSAIQRQGTDITSNDPRLNIPGTIEDTQT